MTFKVQVAFQLCRVHWILLVVFGERSSASASPLLILIHEMGHYIEVKRRGLPADMPVFLPGLGAYVKWQGMGVSLGNARRSESGWAARRILSSAACGLIFIKTGDPIWAALAKTGAWLNASI